MALCATTVRFECKNVSLVDASRRAGGFKSQIRERRGKQTR